MFIELVHNVALLLALALLYDAISLKSRKQKPLLQQLIIGITIGAIGIAVMLSPWKFAPGIVFDTRSILLSISGLFFGTAPTLIAVLMTASLRLYQSGGGVLMGVAVILTSGGIGIAWKYLRKKKQEDMSIPELYLFGLVVHLAMLLATIFLPWSVTLEVLSKISLPVIILYPIGTVLLGKLMVGGLLRKQSEENLIALNQQLETNNQQLQATEQQLQAVNQQLEANNQQLHATEQQLRASNQELSESEAKFKSYIKNAPDGVFVANEKGEYIEVNKAACRITGYSEEELLNLKIPDLIQEKYLEKAKSHFQAIGEMGFASSDFGFITKSGEKRFWSVDAVKLSENRFLGFVKDITEQKQSKEALQESELKLRNIFENSTNLFYSHTIDHVLTYLSPQIESILGYTQEEAMIKWTELASDNPINEIAYEYTMKAIETGERQPTYELELIRKDGKKILVEVREAPIVKDGKTLLIVGSLTDITERKKAEKELIESKERFNLAMKASQDGLFDWNLITNEIYYSPGWKKMLGYEENELPNDFSVWEKLTKPEDAKKSWEILQEAINKKRDRFEMEFKMKHKDGNWIDILSRADAIFDANGKAIRMIGTHVNITKRKKAEQKLKELNERFILATDSALIGIWDLDLINNNLKWDDRMLKLYGFDKDNFEGAYETWQKGVHPDDLERTDREVKQAIRGEKEFDTDFRILWPNNEVRYLKANAQVIRDESGKAIRMIGVNFDITEQKKAQEALKKSELLFSQMFEQSIVSTQLLDLKGNTIRVNSTFCKLFGVTKEDMMHYKIFEDDAIKESDAYLPLKDVFENKNANRWNNKFNIAHASESSGVKTSRPETIFLDNLSYPILDSDKNLQYVVIQHHDITDSKKAEQKLKESEARFKALHNASFGGITIHDKGLIMECNQGLSEITGYSREELIGSDAVKLLIAPESHETVINNITSGYEKPYEAMGVKKNGEKYPIRLEARMIPYKGKEVRVVEFRDITESKKKEAEINKLLTAITQSPSVIVITDTEGNIEYVNPKFTELTGYEFGESIGRKTHILKKEEQPAEVYKELWDTISSGKTWRGEFHNKKKSGELFWEMASISAIFDKQGKIVNYIKVAEDITEKKKTEQELIKAKEKTEESQRKFKSIADTSPLAIYISKGKRQILEYINPTFYKLFGYTYEEVSEVALWWPLAYPDLEYQKNVSEEWNIKAEIAIQNKTDIEPMETIVTCKDGTKKNILWGFFSTGDENWAFGMDLTAYRNTEQNLIKAKEKAEESDRLKSAFLANMSHEIRTPMNGILGFTSLLKEPQLEGEEMTEYISIIEKSGKRMLETINDIIDISKIEAGQVEVVNNEISVNKLLNDQYNFFVNEAAKKGLRLNYYPSLPDNESQIITDQHKLAGIITNLIKNAIKYTETGSITFGYELKHLERKNIFEFSIKDTGIGIPANRIDAIFNRFEQADIEDKRAFEGSGLGLAISKSYVEMLGGKIGVSSKEGSGSTFTFSIPYNRQSLKEAGSRQNKEETSSVSLNSLSVIIAEDDAVSRMYFEALLKNTFKKISFTTTGAETLDKFRENSETDLILMDIKMPDMTGYDATREIRRFNQDVIIIAQTAYGMSDDKERAIEAGCDDYISKPINKEILFEKIKNCLTKKRPK